MRSEQQRQNGSISVKLVFGLLIAAFGLILLADNLDLTEGGALLRFFWPAALALIGVTILLQPSARGASRFWGLAWIVAALWIVGHQIGLLEVRFWDVFFPGALLVLGGSIVWRALSSGRSGASRGSEESDAYVRTIAIMSGNEIRSVASNFRGAELNAFMGGVVLDLRQSKLEADEATIDIFAMWGGIEIIVPREWSVVSKVFPLMGAYEDKSQPASTPPAKRLIVRGTVIMGGVEIKS